MKKFISVLTVIAIVLALFAGCGAQKPKVDYRIAVVQQLDHISLDEIRNAIVAQLNARAQADGFTIEVEVFNGQDDASVLNQIGAQAVADGFDMIIPLPLWLPSVWSLPQKEPRFLWSTPPFPIRKAQA